MSADATAKITPTVLLVDDDPVSHKLVTGFLSKVNATLTIAPNAEDAERFLAMKGFDLILLDVGLPGASGLDLIKRIRAREAGKSHHALVIALTSLNTPEDKERCLKDGMDGFISKPVSRDKLVGMVQRLTKQAVAAKPAQPQ